MNLSSFKRVKHRSLPGDVSKQEKIDLREKAHPDKGTKNYRKRVAMKTRAAGKERARREESEPGW